MKKYRIVVEGSLKGLLCKEVERYQQPGDPPFVTCVLLESRGKHREGDTIVGWLCQLEEVKDEV